MSLTEAEARNILERGLVVSGGSAEEGVILRVTTDGTPEGTRIANIGSGDALISSAVESTDTGSLVIDIGAAPKWCRIARERSRRPLPLVAA